MRIPDIRQSAITYERPSERLAQVNGDMIRVTLILCSHTGMYLIRSWALDTANITQAAGEQRDSERLGPVVGGAKLAISAGTDRPDPCQGEETADKRSVTCYHPDVEDHQKSP